MHNWQVFEKECTNYLNKNFSTYAQFIGKGGTDSTIPDILVETKIGKTFYIEAKEAQAQCGQFVLFPNSQTRRFEYSNTNKSQINQYSETIISHLDKHFDQFAQVDTTGIDIVMSNSQEIFSNWIKTTYENKRIRFFITENFAIIPIEDFSEVFKVTAKYRIKKSGSSKIPAKYIDEVTEYLTNHYPNVKISTLNKRLMATTNQPIDKTRFKLRKNHFLLSLQDNNSYEVKKLSNTYNANVIFSIKLIDDSHKLSPEEFIDVLKK